MPAKRLPWFRFWIDATTHEKVRQLDDGTFRTWVELLDAAAKQPRRGRFASRASAISVVRRPAKHLSTLISAKLIDETREGLVMHDWDEWQRWRPEDANDDATPPDPPPNGRAIDSPTTHDDRANNNSLRARSAAPASGDTETDTEEELPPAATQQSPTAFLDDEQARIDQVRAILVPMGLEGRPEFWRKVLDKYGAIDLEAEALKQADWLRRNKKRQCSELRYLNWLEIASRKAPHATTQRDAQEDQARFSVFRKYA
jgi:hypothetical protein